MSDSLLVEELQGLIRKREEMGERCVFPLKSVVYSCSVLFEGMLVAGRLLMLPV